MIDQPNLRRYCTDPSALISVGSMKISSFLDRSIENIDWDTVASFGDEWLKFSNFDESEIQKIGNDYFDIVDETMLNCNSYVLDVGCGTGRWSKYMANRASFIEAIDPSTAVYSAAKLLRECKNVRVTQASLETIPFPDNTFDFVTSLGVLHHIPDTSKAIQQCVKKLKKGGVFHVYLYYKLDNRPLYFRIIFHFSNLFRRLISSTPKLVKHAICDFVATVVYFPLAKIAKIFAKLSSPSKAMTYIPLAYYQDKSFHIMRNDALDRFGTPLEQRFSKGEIESMLKLAGLTDIIFSNQAPYWHAVGKKS